MTLNTPAPARSFTYSPQPARILFGRGTIARINEEAERLGLRRILAVATPEQEDTARMIGSGLSGRLAGVFASAVMHTPVAVTEAAMRCVTDDAIDGILAVGGGSTIGLSKAIALRTDLPQIVVPTTYAGSEVTSILGETRDGQKVTQSSPRVLPETVIYDVDLTLGLPVALSVTSGINAVAHAVEALYARDGNPIVNLMATEGVRAIVGSLPAIVADPGDAAARSDALYGAWLCGTCLGSVGMSLHHKLCHTLGGAFNLPHAETHCVMLPHALRYNEPAASAAVDALRVALGDDDPARFLYELAGSLGAPRALCDLGMPESGIDRAVELALANPYWNPRPLDAESLRALIADAWAGISPPPAA